jgi:hypothetical protein
MCNNKKSWATPGTTTYKCVIWYVFFNNLNAVKLGYDEPHVNRIIVHDKEKFWLSHYNVCYNTIVKTCSLKKTENQNNVKNLFISDVGLL